MIQVYKQSNHQNFMHHIARKHPFQIWNLLIVFFNFSIIELLTIFAYEISYSFDLLQAFPIQSDNLTRVHQFLLFSQLFHHKLVLFNVLKVQFSYCKDIIEYFFLLCRVGLCVQGLYFFQNSALFIIFERIVDDSFVDLCTRCSIGGVCEYAHHGDVKQQPIIHIFGLFLTHVVFLFMVGIVFHQLLSVYIDGTQLRVHVLQVQSRASKSGPTEVQ